MHSRGHFVAAKTEKNIKQEFYIPRLTQTVEAVITNCVKCIIYDRKRRKAKILFSPITKEDKPLSTYHIDHISPLVATGKQIDTSLR